MVVNYVKNEKGTRLIWYKGFVYVLNRQYSSGRLCWRCVEYSKSKCHSRVHVFEDNIVFESDTHNHAMREDKTGLVDIYCEKEGDDEEEKVVETVEPEDGDLTTGDNNQENKEESVLADLRKEDNKGIMDNEQPTKDFPMGDGDEEDDDVSNVVQVAKSHESILPQHSYIIKPSLEDKFKAYPIRDIIQQTLNATLGGKSYDSDYAKQWTISIANTVNQNIKDLHMKRYKHIVQVTIGELKGAGVKSGLRCLWDSETDGYTSEIFMNDTIFAVVVVFAVYLY